MTALTYTQITGTFVDGSGNPLTNIGITFTPTQTVYAAGVPVVTPGTPITAEVAGGALKNSSGGTLQLLATDNAGLTVESGTGFWFWTVAITGQLTDGWGFFLATSGSPVDLYSLKNTPASGGGGSGTVTSASVVTANGLAGTVATATTTPAITLSTTVTGLLKGNGTAVSAATPGADYLAPTGSGATLTGITVSQVSGAAPLASPALTGSPTAPTQTTGDNSTKVATDAFVTTAVGVETTRAETAEALALPKAGGTMTGALVPAVVTLTFVGSGTTLVNAALGNVFALTLTASTTTLGAPSNPVDGQAIRVRVIQDATGSRTLAYASAWDFGTAGSPTLSTAANAIDYLVGEYNATKSKWCVSAALGF